jgi:hypothetical protein
LQRARTHRKSLRAFVSILYHALAFSIARRQLDAIEQRDTILKKLSTETQSV